MINRKLYIVVVIQLLRIKTSSSSHFAGGSIRPKPLGGTTVQFDWTMGWTLGKGPCGSGCSSSDVGTFVTQLTGSWKCTSGCGSNPIALDDDDYTLTGINTVDQWEQGKDSFTYTFTGTGPFQVTYDGSAWRSLNYGSAGAWTLLTQFDLGTRSDNSAVNTAPTSTNLPIYRIQQGCSPSTTTTVIIPMADDDGDDVRCRWATGAECNSICSALPNAQLSNVGSNCEIVLDTTTGNYAINGWYAVAITIEDFPTSTITLGGNTYSPTTAMSSLPVQFLITTPSYTVSCDDVPEWDTPTPEAGDVMYIQPNNALSFTVHANSTNYPTVKVDTITVSGPTLLTLTPSTGTAADNLGRADTQMVTINWTPATADLGAHSICFQASNDIMKPSEFRCIQVQVVTTLPTSPTTSTTTSATTSATTSVTTSITTSVTTSATTSATTSVTTSATTSPTTSVTTSTTASPGGLNPATSASIAVAAGVSGSVGMAFMLFFVVRRHKMRKQVDAYVTQKPPRAVHCLPSKAKRQGQWSSLA